MKYLTHQQIASTLVEILPGMFAKAGLTILDIEPTADGLFSFRVKEFNPALSFNYDGLCLEMTVDYQNRIMDCLAMVGVPLVAVDGGRYLPCWSGKEGFGAACCSVEVLMRRYLQRRINRMGRTAQEASIDIFQSEGKGFTMARLTDGRRSLNEDDRAYHVGRFNLWV